MSMRITADLNYYKFYIKQIKIVGNWMTGIWRVQLVQVKLRLMGMPLVEQVPGHKPGQIKTMLMNS